MAMQDALHAYNLTAPYGEEIHIRIAASLGEVRVSKSDIFGEPVNVTSRIEGITPADEIYFSEAVYLAMNKAAVPAIEIGIQELEGISKPVRTFSIPRFVKSGLIPEKSSVGDPNPQLSFPFGGMHLSAAPVATTWMSRFPKTKAPNFRRCPAFTSGIGASVEAACLIIGSQFVNISVKVGAPDADANTSAAPTPVALATEVVASPTQTRSIATPTPVVATPTTAPTASPVAAIQSAPARPSITGIAQAKRADRDARISKERYREIARKLQDEYDLYVRRAKIDYRKGRISKQTYCDLVENLGRKYLGE
jgi:adenylate cyclase